VGTELNSILLAADGSGVASWVAADLARRTGAELHVVRVWSADLPGAYALTMPSVRARCHEQKAGETISEDVERIEETGATVAAAHYARGDAATEVCALAAEIDVDLVVVGSRGLGPVGRLTDGSISERVVRLAACPVLMARDGEAPWPPARVVAGVDFPEDSVAVARLAAAIGDLAGAETLLVNAQSPSEIGHKARVSGARRVDCEMLDVRELLLGRVASGIDADVGTRPDMRVIVGDAADAIRAAAQGAGQPVLTAVGSRGLGTLARVTVGSVSTGVLRAARGPVLVYGRPQRRGPRPIRRPTKRGGTTWTPYLGKSSSGWRRPAEARASRCTCPPTGPARGRGRTRSA